MSGIDSSELLLLLVIGLIVLGPKRLPQIANKLGSWIGQARRMTRAMKRQLEEELRLDERPTIHGPVVPPSVATESPNPPAGVDNSEEAGPQVPNDDDTYTAPHDDEPENKSA